MKYLKILAAVALLLAVGTVSYHVGYNKSYEAACRMGDLIRCYEDHLSDPETVIEDYNCFEELEGLFLYDDAVGEPINLKDYVYCY